MSDGVSLPIHGSSTSCTVNREYAHWIHSRRLLINPSDGHVIFYEKKRGVMTAFLVATCVLTIATSEGRKPMHPDGIDRLKEIIRDMTPSMITVWQH
jgi:hypothetical protein